jgi:phytoene dehydrogenase-like protein
MSNPTKYDAVVVGSGPNGLAAALTMTRAGLRVMVIEAADTIGGGTRTRELTLPGFRHDVCSAIHPFGRISPFFKMAKLEEAGLEWIDPPACLAHPFDDGTVALLERSVENTAESLGVDSEAYMSFIKPLLKRWRLIDDSVLGPLQFPKNPFAMISFGLKALRSARGLAESRFRGKRARSLFCGIAAHGSLPLERTVSASFGMVLLTLAHVNGWPFPRGGSYRIAEVMTGILKSKGGEIVIGQAVRTLSDIPPARAILFDLTPRQIIGIAREALPFPYLRKLERYRYGAGVFKVDWALREPAPFAVAECRRAATVHLAGSMAEIAESQRLVARGEFPDRPFVLFAQQSQFDPTRAPSGRHTAWAYCHVPSWSDFDMTERIEAQMERFAPGFKDVILARHAMGPRQLEEYNSNCIGGDISGGLQDWRQLFTRPTWSLTPYRMPVRGMYICSSSTPPGGGVHGMCGYWAARTALKDIFKIFLE